MRSSTNIISALGTFLGYHSGPVGFPIATCCVFLAALLLGIVVPTGAQPPCTLVAGQGYQSSSYNPCTVYNTGSSCAPSGPGYTCTAGGINYPEYYSFTANDRWWICTWSDSSQTCNWAVTKENCGFLDFYTSESCGTPCTPTSAWAYFACEAANDQ